MWKVLKEVQPFYLRPTDNKPRQALMSFDNDGVPGHVIANAGN